MYLTILGRQPAISIAELKQVFGHESVDWFSDNSATVKTENMDIARLGGTLKIGHVIAELSACDWRQASTKIIQHYIKKFSKVEYKVTIGISAYGFDVNTRDVQKTGIILKQKLKKSGVNLRLIPNNESALSSASSHNNKLGLSNNKIEIIVVRSRAGNVLISQSIGAQNITAYANRDQKRPKRDAFVGMLPPKLAQIMINLAMPSKNINHKSRILDPFCGTGVILQEAALMGYSIYGSDVSEKMISYSDFNLKWLKQTHTINFDIKLGVADATSYKWSSPIDAVVCESYLGQPFSAPPSTTKLDQVRNNCQHIISSFLRNISTQLKTGTPLCIAVPAWRKSDGSFTQLDIANKLDSYGLKLIDFKGINQSEMIYCRQDQIVARQILVMVKQ